MTEDRRSKFWQQLGDEHRRDLDRFGFATVKRHQALRYFNWRWNWTAAVRSSQLRFLLTHLPPKTWRQAVRRPVLSDEAWSQTGWSKLERWLYTFAVRLLWRYASAHGSKAVLDLPEPLLGAPLPVEFGGRLISQDLANSALEIRAMAPALEDGPRSFLEVGAGYGRTAYALLSLYPHASYTIVDIEPAIGISRWYLSQLFGAERLTFLHPKEADSVESGSIDLALTISSLQEMTPEDVSSYLHLFDRVAAGGYVYLKQWTSWHNADDDLTVNFADYPFPSRWTPIRWGRAPVQTEFTEALWAIPGPRRDRSNHPYARNGHNEL